MEGGEGGGAFVCQNVCVHVCVFTVLCQRVGEAVCSKHVCAFAC